MVFVPGVIGTLTLVIIVNLTAFAIVREREVGTLEQIMVTPIRPAEFILGKTVPSFVIGLGEGRARRRRGPIVVSGAVRRQSAGDAARDVVIPVEQLALGLLISTMCTTQQQAFATNFFVAQSVFHPVGFQLSDFEHAAGAAMVHLYQSVALLSRRHPRHFP